jgi:hypothetical protein
MTSYGPEHWPQAPPAPPAGGYPSQLPAQQGPILVTVGDISCTQTEVIPPAGRAPLARTTWITTNQTMTVERIPPYAIVLAVVFALACLLGLLFLLIKERQVQGYVQVSVQGDRVYWATQVPVSGLQQMADVENRAHYIRTLVAALG